MGYLHVSELAERSGVAASTLRFYERKGLLPAERSPGGYRLYDEDSVERLAFITTAKANGLSLDEIGELLTVWEEGVCGRVRDRLRPMVTARIDHVEQRIEDLTAFRDRLLRAAQVLAQPAPPGRCDPQCPCVHRPCAPVPVELSLAPTRAEQAGRAPDGMGFDERAARWRELTDQVQVTRTAPGVYEAVLPLHRAAQAARLAATEQTCARRISIELAFTGTGVRVSLRAPDEHPELVGRLLEVPSESGPGPAEQKMNRP